MQRRTGNSTVALVALITLVAWLLIGLPLIYARDEAVGFWGWLSKDASGFFTFLMLVVATTQIGLFWYQLRLIRISLDEAKVSATAAADAAKASARQANIAEETFGKIERPYLFVFNINKLDLEDYESADDDYTLLKVTYSIANHGKIPAIIKHVQLSLMVFSEPLPPPRLENYHSLIAATVFAPGEVRSGIEESLRWDGDLAYDEGGSRFPALGGNDLWFSAIIAYRGPFTDQHETRICLRYDQETGWFTRPFGGPEHSGEK